VPYQQTSRHYVEIFFINCFLENQDFPKYALGLLSGPTAVKIQPLMSLIFVTGYRIVNSENTDSEVFENLVYKMACHIGSNTTYVRALSQYFIAKLSEVGKLNFENNQKVELILQIIFENVRNNLLRGLFNSLVDKYSYLIEDITVAKIWETKIGSERLEVSHGYIIEDLKKIAHEVAAEVRNEEGAPRRPLDIWTKELTKEFDHLDKAQDLTEGSKANVGQEKSDEEKVEFYQRKIDTLLSVVPEWNEESRPAELIIVASLVEKLPNLANLTRTCEVFGISGLVIPNKKILEHNDYKNVTMTAEKWLPLYECPPANLVEFIRMKKMSGYAIMALEQTSSSQKLSEFKWPNKGILVLGAEKTGIPLNVLQYVDTCIEIEQFGKVRSLNVHISAVVAAWQFIKQKYIKQLNN
jgi:tRNA G18 (ribose-2'-O)-methylase SpoU